MPDYRPDDFSPPLSDDAAIMLLFVQEKKRAILRLQARVGAYVTAAFLVGMYVGRLAS